MTVAAASSGLFLLFVLACPVGMGLMMWYMGRGMGMGRKHKSDDRITPDHSLADLKAEQARLAEKIESLESSRTEQERTSA